MRRLLVIAYYFPPIGGIGSIRMGRFARFLNEFGWEPTVIAPRHTPHPSDGGLESLEENVIRSPSIELSRLGRALPSRSRAVPRDGTRPGNDRQGSDRTGLRRALQTHAHRFIFYPDAQIGWYPGAVLAGLSALRRTDYDAVFSSSNPVTAHLVARTLSRKAGLPWIAEFRDPWSDRLPSDHPYRRHASALTESLITGATRVIVPTPTLARHYGERWGREITVVQNGHDLERPVHVAPDRPTLTHIGSYYPGGQSFQALWRALAMAVHARPPEAPLVRFIGELPEEIRRETSALGIDGLVEATGFLPHESAMREMMSSTMLIASGFTGRDPISLGVIPAKLFEYLASGLPILYIGHREDDAAHILKDQPGCYVIEPDDVEGASAALRDGLKATLFERDVTAMSRRARTAELAAILDRTPRR